MNLLQKFLLPYFGKRCCLVFSQSTEPCGLYRWKNSWNKIVLVLNSATITNYDIVIKMSSTEYPWNGKRESIYYCIIPFSCSLLK